MARDPLGVLLPVARLSGGPRDCYLAVMSAALRARVVGGHLVVVGAEHLPEGKEFELVPVPGVRGLQSFAGPANDREPTLLDLIASEVPDEAFAEMLDRPQ